MTKKFKRNLILISLGTVFLLLGIILIVIYQNRNSFSSSTINVLKIIHEKIILDYLLIIIGSVLLAIPFFDLFFISGYNLSEVKIKKPNFNKKNNQEAKVKELEKEINQDIKKDL